MEQSRQRDLGEVGERQVRPVGHIEQVTWQKAAEDGRDQAIQDPIVCDKGLELDPVFTQCTSSPILRTLPFQIELKSITSMNLLLTSPGLKWGKRSGSTPDSVTYYLGGLGADDFISPRLGVHL